MKKLLSLLIVSAFVATSAGAHDVVLRNQGKAILGVSYPADWKQVVDKNHVIATSEDGQAWSVISTLDDIQDQQAGVAKVKEGFEDYLKDIKFDELTKTESGSLVLSGVGKGKTTDVDVVFTSAVFESGPGQLSAIAFIVDADIEKYYEKSILAICSSILVEGDFIEEAEQPADER